MPKAQFRDMFPAWSDETLIAMIDDLAHWLMSPAGFAVDHKWHGDITDCHHNLMAEYSARKKAE